MFVLVHGVDPLEVLRQTEEHAIDLDRWSILRVAFEQSPQVAILEDEQLVPDDGDGIVVGVARIGNAWQWWPRRRMLRPMVMMMVMVVMHLGRGWNVRGALRVWFPRIGLLLVGSTGWVCSSDASRLVSEVDSPSWDFGCSCGCRGSSRVVWIVGIETFPWMTVVVFTRVVWPSGWSSRWRWGCCCSGGRSCRGVSFRVASVGLLFGSVDALDTKAIVLWYTVFSTV